MFVSLLIVWRGVGGTVSSSIKQESVLSTLLLNFKEEMLSSVLESELVTVFNSLSNKGNTSFCCHNVPVFLVKGTIQADNDRLKGGFGA
jgi:hypothetical protein